ncbi:MAG: efflux RND transporter permease subunit, partial [Burkholderiales bacterium]|nr:efflux RND transporter permease subunit [Phycisphaerae bacterium]
MQRFVDLFIKRPVFASMIILALVVVGAAAYTRLGVDRFPSVDLPTVSVRTRLPGASPEEVENQLSDKLEEVVNTVSGLDELRSISSNGNSVIIATFDLNRDIDSATQDVRDKVATVVSRLPERADTPTISKFDNDSQPVITFALSGDLSLRELTEIADKTVKKALEPGQGVGQVSIVGGAARVVNIDVDADRLASYGLPISAIGDAVRQQNSEVPGGNLTGAQSEQSLRTMGRIEEPAQFAEIILKYENGAAVRIRDVATVTDGTAEMRSVARLNGAPSVSLDVRRQSGANTIAVIESVKALAEKARANLPPGVQLQVIRDQSSYINNALHEINHHLVVGSILACLVVLMFTRSWRSTVIAGVAIPASVISTFAVMWALDFTLNSVTMLALVLMVGIVIDDAIVVLENIFRFVEEKKMPAMEAARQATGEIATAVLATTLSLAIIFVPVSFMSSISGRFLYQFGITAAVAVLVSLLVSFVLTPTLSARMLGKEAAKAGEAREKSGGGDHNSAGSRAGFYQYLDRPYTWMLKWVMRHRLVTASLALLVALSSIGLFRMVPQGYLPQGQDEAEFQVSVSAPEQISFPAMNAVMLDVERDLMKNPHVTTTLTTVGGGFIGGVNSGDVYVRIPPHEERYFSFTRFFKSLLKFDPAGAFRGNYTQTDVMQAIRADMRKYSARGLRVSVRNFPGFNIGGGNFDIDFSVGGPDLPTLATITKELVRRGEAIGGIVNLDTTLKLDKPELLVKLDRDRAADLGISTQDIGTAVSLMVGGDEEISDYRDRATNEDYDVRLRLAPEFRRNPS